MSPTHNPTLLLLYLIVAVQLVFLIPASYVESREWGPWDRDRVYEKEVKSLTPRQPKSPYATTVTTFPLKLLITFFQKVISPVDGPTCDFYPTCSGYSIQVLKKHGLLLGLAMASERIIRDHTQEGYDLIFKFGRYYMYDPVENNDFWFTKKERTLK